MENRTAHFNEEMRQRTRKMATRIFDILSSKKSPLLSRTPIQQLVRCSTSVAANYRSATRGRSDAEFYSKICIVTEECDETLFWIDFLTEVGILTDLEVKETRDEVEQLLRIFCAIKTKMKYKLSLPETQ